MWSVLIEFSGLVDVLVDNLKEPRGRILPH
jgi:hypothetical protein